MPEENSIVDTFIKTVISFQGSAIDPRSVNVLLSSLKVLDGMLSDYHDSPYKSAREDLARSFEQLSADVYAMPQGDYYREAYFFAVAWLKAIAGLLARKHLLQLDESSIIMKVYQSILGVLRIGSIDPRAVHFLLTSLTVLDSLLVEFYDRHYREGRVAVMRDYQKIAQLANSNAMGEYYKEAYNEAHRWADAISGMLARKAVLMPQSTLIVTDFVPEDAYLPPFGEVLNVKEETPGEESAVQAQEEEAADQIIRIGIGQQMDRQKEFESWILNWIYSRREQQRPINLVFVGETGSGKSYSALSLAEKVDPNFSTDNIVFTIEQFMAKLNSRPPAGTVIVFDEAGLEISNKEWHDMQIIIFGKTAQSMRYRGIMVFYTVPRLPFIDSTTRQLIQLLLESTGERGTMKPFLIRPSSDRNDNRPWYVYPKVTITDSDERTLTYEYRATVFPMPPKNLYVPYEAKKDEYLTGVFTGMEDSLKKMREAKEEKQVTVEQYETGVQLTCNHCGYTYNYKKPSWDVKCPRCKKVITIPENLKPYVGTVHPPLSAAGTGTEKTGQSGEETIESGEDGEETMGESHMGEAPPNELP